MSRIQILKDKIIQIQFEDYKRKIAYNDVNFNRVELKKTLTSHGTNSSILIYQKEGSIITLKYNYDKVVAENDFALLENYISPDLPF